MLKRHFRERFLFNYNVNIINPTLKWCPHKKQNSIFTKIKLIQPILNAFQISTLILLQNISSSKSSLLFEFLFIYKKHLLQLVLCFNHNWPYILVYKVHLKILRGHLDIQGTQRVLGHLEGTRHSEGIWRELEGNLGTWALRHSEI